MIGEIGLVASWKAFLSSIIDILRPDPSPPTRSWWWNGLRQLLLGAVAAALTWCIGRWIGGG